jgi:hypothetical protein
VLFNIPLRIPAAHPTPERTAIAPNLQFKSQAPHSMQLSISIILAFPSVILKTACGQTMAHIPQPVHKALLSFKVATPLKYCIVFILN